MLARIQQRVLPVVWKTWEGWQEHDGFLLSAAMAYYAAFSLFPLCLVLIAVMGFIMRMSPGAQDAQQELIRLVSQQAGDWLADQLQVLLSTVKTQAGLGGPIGAITLLIGAIGVFVQFDAMFDRIWHTGPPPARGWLSAIHTALWDRLTAFLMLLAVGGLIVVVFIANIVLAGARESWPQWLNGSYTWSAVQISFTVISNALLMGIVYKVMPQARVGWWEAFSGGLLVSVVWQVGQIILVRFVLRTGYSAYGIVGSFIAVMLWLYYVSSVIFLGAEFVRVLCSRRSGEGSK